MRMRLGMPDASGRQSVAAGRGQRISPSTADLVIKALGFDPEELPAPSAQPELEVTRWGTLKIDHRTFMTSLPGVFAAGDIVRGASLVVWAIRDGRDAAAADARLHAARTRAVPSPRSDAHDRRFRRRLERQRRPPRAAPTTPARSTMPAASAWSPRWTASRAATWCRPASTRCKAVWHRGAVDADGKTGDGAGIHIEIPQDFFADAIARGGHKLDPRDRIAVGMVFLPKTDLGAQERCRQIVETEILELRLQHLWLAPGADQRRRASARRPTRPGPRSSRS